LIAAGILRCVRRGLRGGFIPLAASFALSEPGRFSSGRAVFCRTLEFFFSRGVYALAIHGLLFTTHCILYMMDRGGNGQGC
jgi:hypothetical protein